MSLERPPKKRSAIEGTDLELRRAAALYRARELSHMLINEYPEIADDYQHSPATELVSKYFPTLLGPEDTENVYHTAIQMALRELLGKKRKKRLGVKHQRLAVSRAAKQMYEEGRGISALTADEKSAVGRKGGQAGAASLAAQGKGIVFQTLEERQTAAKLSHEARGLTPYTTMAETEEYGPLEERVYILRLKADLEFKQRGGWNNLLDRVNRAFGNNRTLDDVQNIYYRSKPRP